MLDSKIKEICEKHEFLEPVELLVGLTNGIDLRRLSVVYDWLSRFEEEYGGEAMPDELEWLQLKDLIKQHSKFSVVSSTESLTAQKVLIEYQHPKKKSVDVTAHVSTSGAVTPLTSVEIRKFKRKFNKVV